MSLTEEEKLKIRIEHWIEHNAGHAKEFAELAAAIRSGKNSGASGDLLKAADELQKANQWLKEAAKKIGGT
jgi:hypothetical protein